MDFSLSTEQLALRDSVRKFCVSQYSLPQRQRIAREDQGLRRAHWNLFAQLGWLGAGIPEDAGGVGGSAIECAIIAEELGRALVLEPYLASAVAPAWAIRASLGTPACRELLESLVRGDVLFAFAHFEPGSGEGCADVQTSARRTASGEYVLNGRKSPVIGGLHADRLIVSARTAGECADRSGVSLFVVDSAHPGLVARPFRLLDGTTATELRLHEVALPVSARLGTEGEALEAIEATVAMLLLGLCAQAIGAMDDMIALTASYLRTRRAYGTTLITFQALQHRLADMLIELELSRSITHRALAVFAATGDGARRLTASSAAKALVGRSARFVSANGLQLHGGMGMAEEYVVGQHFKQLTVFDNLCGNSEFHWHQCALEKDGHR
jgi:alkylation response protein AidB-like acyl-CoA dehydrogenase